MDRQRLNRLNKFFENIIYGRQAIEPSHSSLFVEAICSQQDRPACISRVIAGKGGLAAIQSVMQFHLDPAFFDGDASKLLAYLQAPEIRDLGAGALLHQVIQKIIDPPIFWDSFRQSFIESKLSTNGQQNFCWLLHYLVAHPSSSSIYRDQASVILNKLLPSTDSVVRDFGEKIKFILNACNSGATPVKQGSGSPGGRHDNDFADFREVSIVPTADEIACTKQAFLRSCAEVDGAQPDARIGIHLDNQFRLLREDMIYELKEEVQIALGKKKGRHRGMVIEGLQLSGIYCGPDRRRCNWGLTFKCPNDLPGLKGSNNRKKALADNRNLLRHQSMTCLLLDGEIAAFPTINREEELLAQNPPIIVLQVEGEATTKNVLVKLKAARNIKLFQIDTAMFSYAPILQRLQNIRDLPLLNELLLWDDTKPISAAPGKPDVLVGQIQLNSQRDLQDILKTPRSIQLDRYQAASLVSGLAQSVSLIQGPPGTGKSLIGALIAKGLYDHTRLKILVVCYTNHALDDILTSLLEIGIPQESMVRLGGKSTTKTEPLLLQKQPSTFRRDRGTWAVIDNLKAELGHWYSSLETSFAEYLQSTVSPKDILDHIEFEDVKFHAAFRIPLPDESGLRQVGRGGKAVDETYLIQRWINGNNGGIFADEANVQGASDIWSMNAAARQAKLSEWKRDNILSQIDGLYSAASKFNDLNTQILQQLSGKDTDILRDKTIIGCTTTAAAKYSNSLQAVAPDVLLVEEAGEILESHILTALSRNTKQLIMIGDHKQLRPKVNHYRLTVEKGEGFDLNRSLFERLILKGYPHKTLTKQHRMRPEISALIRSLTYPELSDALSTQKRPNLRGVQNNIVFVNHSYPEDNFAQIADRRDGGSKSSKQNSYEVEMILRILRYLAQQGYSTDQMVILTPYLGQLHKLQAVLRNGKENDPLLNDLDSHDLVKAGLMTTAAAKMARKPIRLATIDNYQGEESDVVITSLTRSNPQNDIGFMFSPERLNVLLSRARNALIIVGNSNTFSKSRKGGDMWRQLFDLLRKGKHVFEGLPVVCQRHPDQTALLKTVADFEVHCPDGGCTKTCGILLNCGIHECPSKCHQIVDHSKMRCESVSRSPCDKGHQQMWKCHQGRPALCNQCEKNRKAAEAKLLAEFELQQRREAEQCEHDKEIDRLNAQIAEQEQLAQATRLTSERKAIIRQKEEDLKASVNRVAQLKAAKVSAQQHKSSGSNTRTGTDENNSQRPPSTPPGPTSFNQTPPQDHVPPKDSPPNPNTNTGTQATSSQSPSQPDVTSAPLANQPSKHIPPLPLSPAEQEWQRQKSLEGASDAAIDELMAMTGLEAVKEAVLTTKASIDLKRRQGISLANERLNSVFLGNPGTGKTTVARLYAKFLASARAIPNDHFQETTGSRLANEGVSGAKAQLENVLRAGGGAIFIDEAYQLTADHNHQGRQVLDFLLAEMENYTGKLVFILAGYSREMESFFEHNPGLPSRIPYRFLFADYSDSELLAIFKNMVEKLYSGKMRIEGGTEGLFVRIVIKRLARGRGRPGFGNARDLQNIFQQITHCQAKRVHEGRKLGMRPNDFFLTKEDLIGPRPSDALERCEAWKELQKLIGLESVKAAVRNLTDTIERNYVREIKELEPLQFSLNRIFLGSPGTGKTTVATLYGKILADLRILSNGEVITKNPADFIGAVLGESEKKTKGILATTRGKVLIIDEAYMLYGGREGHTNSNDSFKTAVIDTIVAEVQNVPGDDRCVLLLGYKDPMMEMFQNVNEGLSRRFSIEDPFIFEDFSNTELLQILDRKLKLQDIGATGPAKETAIQLLDRARNRPNFGNGGEVENLLSRAKLQFQARIRSQDPRTADVVLEPQDFDIHYDRHLRSSDNLKKLFEDVIGLSYLVKKLEGYQRVVRVAKDKGLDFRDLIPFNFIFKGPPGTGKTTVARKMGQVYYDMGILSTVEVTECSASDLVGQWVGHTGPKTQKLLEKALGQVLFIDEAYRLSEGHFAQEAIDELVGLLTQDKYKGKLIVILAGYDQDMNQLLAVNSGLSSRFPEQIIFHNMPPAHCIEILQKQLEKKNIYLPGLDSPLSDVHGRLTTTVTQLSMLPSWGNARDIVTLARKMIQEALISSTSSMPDGKTELSLATALKCADNMLMEQRERCSNLPSNKYRSKHAHFPMQTNIPTQAPPPSANTDTNMAQQDQPTNDASRHSADDGRDPGVPDHTWHELQQAKKAEEERQTHRKVRVFKSMFWLSASNPIGCRAHVTSQNINLNTRTFRCEKQEEAESIRMKKDLESKEEQARLEEQRAEATQKALKAAALEAKQQFELLKKLGAERLQALHARRLAAEMEQKKRQEDERREKEKQREIKVQSALRKMGACPRGFRWIKIANGYRCAGGTHFVSDAALRF